MALTKEDLQAIREVVQDEIKPISERLAVIEVDHTRKINLVLESQVDMNRNLEDMSQRLTAVEGTLANSVVIKAVAPKE
ncbi:hypothetical protein LJC04_06080 [Ruminococcaceae bacterium OttesenSCG-928-O06]|nr:hypothetical protein [Ruminococcaceae bacterium OttesenSCG-928-O06]